MKKQELINAFKKSEEVCPFCKNEKTWVDKSWDEKTKEDWYHRTCSCGGKWIPKEPTEDNLKRLVAVVGGGCIFV